MQIILQKVDCFDVEVVCWFIEEKKFCVFDENLSESDFFEHAAGKSSHFARHIFDSESAQNRADLRFVVPERAFVHFEGKIVEAVLLFLVKAFFH